MKVRACGALPHAGRAPAWGTAVQHLRRAAGGRAARSQGALVRDRGLGDAAGARRRARKEDHGAAARDGRRGVGAAAGTGLPRRARRSCSRDRGPAAG
eukprot:772621-Prymnesium_polylepis.1